MTIRIAVQRASDRVRVQLTPGILRPQLIRTTQTGAVVALVGTQATLLGGDRIDIEIEVGPGLRLELIDVAGTVAFDSGGVPAGWAAKIAVAEAGMLLWQGQPFVVATGALVGRSTRIDLAVGALACLRETLVLGRSGECGGALTVCNSATHSSRPLLVEQLDLTDLEERSAPGILGPHRVIDSVSVLGLPAPRGCGSAGERFDLDGPGTVLRYLGTETARSPAGGWWDACVDALVN